jgi:hypothetical protein
MQAHVKKRKTGTKPHKQPKRRCLAPRSRVQRTELEKDVQGNTSQSTVTTSLTAAATPALVTLLRDVVNRTSQITVLANLVGTTAVLRLLETTGRSVPQCVFTQTFFNWCSQVCSTLKGKHELIRAKLADTAEMMLVKDMNNRAYLRLSTNGRIDCLQPHNLPSRDGLATVLNYESRKRVVRSEHNCEYLCQILILI